MNTLRKPTKAQVSTSQTAEWLMDNFYVIEQAVRQVEEDLPADYYQRLPKTRDGWARIHIVALVKHASVRMRALRSNRSGISFKSFRRSPRSALVNSGHCR